MLYGSQSISYYSKSNTVVWMSMAFQAGILNIGGFMACHRFVSHITGFATFFGYEVVNSDIGQVFGTLLVPMFFLLGSMLSGWLVDLRLKLQKKPKYYIVFGIIFFLLLIVFLGGIFGRFGKFGEALEFSRDYTLLILLCFTCGIQNGTIATVSRSVVRTTHLTGITTDLGIGLIRILNRHKISEQIPDEGKANLMRLGIICSFGIGSILGGFLFSYWAYWGFLAPLMTSGILFASMLYFQLIKSNSVVAC